MSIMKYPCSVCNTNVGVNSIFCDICSRWVHRQCAKLNNCELQYYGSLSSDWYCRECITSTFPFGGLNEEELDLFLNRDAPGKLQDIYIKCQDLNFEPFKFIDFNSNDPDADIDPDNNFYNHVTVDSLYYTEQQLEANNKEVGQGFSIIHFNARSMSANFEEIRSYLQEFSWKFDIIALSETWQKNDVNTDFKIIGYDDYGRARKERTGGGVLLYVHAELKGNMHMISPDRTRFYCQLLAYLATIHRLYGTRCLSY